LAGSFAGAARHQDARGHRESDLERRADRAVQQALAVVERVRDRVDDQRDHGLGDLAGRDDRAQRQDARVPLAVALGECRVQRARGRQLELLEGDLLAAADHGRDDGERVGDRRVDLAAAR
jgi:hypothetical protein